MFLCAIELNQTFILKKKNIYFDFRLLKALGTNWVLYDSLLEAVGTPPLLGDSSDNLTLCVREKGEFGYSKKHTGF